MSRHRWELRDAAVAYASRGIPVLPLHHPLPHPSGLQPVPSDSQPAVARAGCSCRDPECGQPGKHPLGALVLHGLKEATCNRARVLAWWTRHPQANIGLATGHRFDVLDVDGPAGAQAIQELAAAHGLQSSGPRSALVVVAGTTTWSPPASAAFNPANSTTWIGGGWAAMWSPHPAATPLAIPTSGHPGAISIPRWVRSRQRCEPGWNAGGRNDLLVRWRLRPPAPTRATATPGRP
jgi:hypothetical protein